jgi:hypothetical protein
MNIGIFAASLGLAATMAPSQAWLDARAPSNWNVPGAAISAAPPWRVDGRIVKGGKDPELLSGGRCASTVQPAAGAAERAVSARGWLIARVVPALPNSGAWTVVMGISGADGMCRPLGYQLFTFHDGSFVGTLSPHLMDARTDASFVALRPAGPNTLQANFLRYADQDALCCPHATTRVTFSIVNGRRPVIAPTASRTMPNSG